MPVTHAIGVVFVGSRQAGSSVFCQRTRPSLRRRLPAVAAHAVPPGVTELQIPGAVEAGTDFQPRVDTHHERREKTTPRRAGHADAVLVDLRARFEIGNRLEECHDTMGDRRVFRIGPMSKP